MGKRSYKRVEYGPARVRGSVFAAFGLFVVAVAVAVLAGLGDPEDQRGLWPWLVIPFGALMTLLGGWLATRKGPVLVLDTEGFEDRTSLRGAGWVPWSDVSYIGLGQVARSTTIEVGLRGYSGFPTRQLLTREMSEEWSARGGGARWTIQASNIGAKPKVVVAAMTERWHAAIR